MNDVVSMTAAGVDETLIINHIRAHGVAAPLTTEDVIALHQQGVSTNVIKTLQNPPQPVAVAQPAPVVAPTPVIVEEHHYGPAFIPPPYPHRHWYPRRHHRPGVSWGISFGN
jgi:hypothetical protein